MPTRIAIVADTHMPKGSRRLPDGCVSALRDADLIVHAGDFTGPDVLAAFRDLGPPLVAVHGNVDAREVVAELPRRAELEVEGVRVAVVHDAGPRRGRLGRMRREFPDASAVIFGHSHLPLLEEEEGFQVFNPGSPTERRRGPRRSMGLARVTTAGISFEHRWLG